MPEVLTLGLSDLMMACAARLKMLPSNYIGEDVASSHRGHHCCTTAGI